MHSLNIFHRKILRGILNLSRNSNIAPLYFLLGELPIEAQIHRDVFALFYNVWSNQGSKIYSIVKYLLNTSSSNSRTWSMFVRHLSEKYGITDPLEFLKIDAPTKSSFKELIITKICSFHEKQLREKAKENSRMKYLNVSLMSLRGQHHRALSNIVTSHEVKKCRTHLKMLCGDFLTYEVRAKQSGGSPHCRVCPYQTIPTENISHILTSCEAYQNIRNRILPQLQNTAEKSYSNLNFNYIMSNNETLCQFILDPSSINLRNRVNENDPTLPELFKISRDYCFAIGNERTKLLKILSNQQWNLNRYLVCYLLFCIP